MKMMKKTLIVLMMMLVALAALAVKSSATTKEELKNYVLNSKGVAGSSLTITEADRAKVEKFFKENEITDEQAGAIKSKVDAAISIMTKDGANHPNALSSKELKQEVLALAQEAAEVVGYTVSYDASEERLDLYKDGKAVESLNWGVEQSSGNGTTEPALVQTGTTNYAYVAVAGVVLVAGITLFVARKKSVKANA